MRIAKYIAHSGLCSRRNAEKLIEEGKVYINNQQCIKPNIDVNINDKITVNKILLKLEKKTRLWKFYKPPKILCTNKDDKKRKTLFEILPRNIPRVVSVGRLDYMSEGLILITNNGDLSRKLELPSSNYQRVYKLYVIGNVTPKIINKINNGVSIKGIRYNKAKVKIEKKQKFNTILIFKLKEGKNREIRNICNFFNLKIVKLIRIEYGPIKLLNLNIGQLEEIKDLKKLC